MSVKKGIQLFDEFFESGMEESISPFLTPETRGYGKGLHLKASLCAAALLVCAYILSFFPDQKAAFALCLLFVYFLAGVPALIGALSDLLDFEVNIDVLMTLAAFLSILIGSGKEGGLLLVLFSFSGALEEMVSSKAKGALSALRELAPTKAWVLHPDGRRIERAIYDIGVGELIFVQVDQIVPLDGVVVAGRSSVNLAHLTGESLPLLKKEGDEVPSGARNLETALTLRVTHTSSDSTLSRIIALITRAQESKPTVQRWIDKATDTYALSIILLALLFALLLPFVTSLSYLGPGGSIYRALTFLIAASPCALVIAIPISYLSAISATARQGVLLKGGIALDKLAACRTLAIDKTGTLTEGRLSCLGISTFGKLSLNEGLALALALERHSSHPIARAIVSYAEARGIAPLPVTEFKQHPGLGVEGLYEGKKLQIGNREFLSSQLTPALRTLIEPELEMIKRRGEQVSLLLFQENLLLFRFKDLVRRESAEAIARLQRECKIEPVMLTGDHLHAARAIADEVGIYTVYAELRPEDKLRHVKHLADQGPLAMVGDGINDAPALAAAMCGIACGQFGSGAAIASADIVLLRDQMDLLPGLFHMAHKTRAIVKQNLFLAIGAIAFAVLPALWGMIPLWLAVVLHEGGTVLVGLNALRLLRYER